MQHWAVRPALIGALVGGGFGALGMMMADRTAPAAAATAMGLNQTSHVKPQPSSPERPFRNCTEARAADAAPVYENDPGYAPWLDGDHDGIGCEPYHGRDQATRIAPQSVAGVRQFRNCAEARAAGAAPVYESDPRYGPWLDGDGDGIGCEPYRGRH